MRLIVNLLILSLALGTLQSCVSKKKYDELMAAKEATDQALAETQAQAAQQVFKHGAPDFVLMDYQLNDQSNGLQVMRYLDNLLETRLPAIIPAPKNTSHAL